MYSGGGWAEKVVPEAVHSHGNSLASPAAPLPAPPADWVSGDASLMPTPCTTVF